MALQRPDGTWLVARTASGDWHPEEIKAAVRMKTDDNGKPWSLDRLATSNGLPAHACRSSVNKTDAAGEALIATLLGLEPRDIWPTRYLRDGSRINPGRRAKNSDNAAVTARHCEFRGAA